MKDFIRKPKQGHGFIYRYISPSNKNYIGQTTKSLKERAKNNGNGYKNCSVFYNAILKYGFKNFKIEILGEFKIEFLDNKEKYYINLFNSLVPFGYNIYEGGASYYDKRKRTTPIKQYNLQGEFIRDYNSLIEAAEDNKTSYQAISAVLNHKRKSHKGFIYKYINDNTKIIPIERIPTVGRKTGQFTKEGFLINIYESANAAAKAVGGSGRNIRAVCLGDRKTAYGYIWKYLE
jgi:group I intron endonuclease